MVWSFWGEKWTPKDVDQIQGFIFIHCKAWFLGLSKAKRKTKLKNKKKPSSLPLEDHGKNLISAMICKWEASQQSNFPHLSRASVLTWNCCKHCLLELFHCNRVFHLNKALLDLVAEVERVMSCIETPFCSQRPCDFPESTEILDMTMKIWTIHPKALAPLLMASPSFRVCRRLWVHFDHRVWGTKRSWEGPGRVTGI